MNRRPNERDEANAFGKRLREIRKRRGLTQRELAEKIGLKQSMIAQYEGGYIRLNAAALIVRLSKALDSSPNELLDFEEMRVESPVRNRRLLRRLKKIDQLPLADQKALVRFLDALMARQEAEANPRRQVGPQAAKPQSRRHPAKETKRSRVA